VANAITNIGASSTTTDKHAFPVGAQSLFNRCPDGSPPLRSLKASATGLDVLMFEPIVSSHGAAVAGRSTATAMPCPPPMHKVASPR